MRGVGDRGVGQVTPAQCRAARGALGWSQTDLSERSGVSKSTIAAFELGHIAPHRRTLRDLVEAFEMIGVTFCKNGLLWRDA